MGEAALKAMVIIALGMVAGAGLAGGLAGAVVGAVVGKAAGVPVVITAPIGAALRGCSDWYRYVPAYLVRRQEG